MPWPPKELTESPYERPKAMLTNTSKLVLKQMYLMLKNQTCYLAPSYHSKKPHIVGRTKICLWCFVVRTALEKNVHMFLHAEQVILQADYMHRYSILISIGVMCIFACIYIRKCAWAHIPIPNLMLGGLFKSEICYKKLLDSLWLFLLTRACTHECLLAP